jgi:integrase
LQSVSRDTPTSLQSAENLVGRLVGQKMAKGIELLRDLQVQHAKKTVRDGGGLYLYCEPGKPRRWAFRFTLNGKRREMGLGSLDAVSLTAARTLAKDARQMVASGVDPIEARQQKAILEAANKAAKLPFGQFVEEWLETAILPSLSNKASRQAWRYTLLELCKPISERQIGSIETADILKLLLPIWNATPETGKRLQGRLERAFDAALANGNRATERGNPARWRGHLKSLLPSVANRERGNHAAMGWANIPDFYAKLTSTDAMSALCLRFIIQTAARPNEGLGATWGEIDLERREWSIPASRMKGRKPHVVPLTNEAVAILESVKQLSNGAPDAYVFPNNSGLKPMTDAALGKTVRRYAVTDATTHGLRSDFRTWAHESARIAWEVSEGCLSHVVGNATARAYLRGEGLERRREALEAWSGYVLGRKTNLVHLVSSGAR